MQNGSSRVYPGVEYSDVVHVVHVGVVVLHGQAVVV